MTSETYIQINMISSQHGVTDLMVTSGVPTPPQAGLKELTWTGEMKAITWQGDGDSLFQSDLATTGAR